MKTVVTYKGHTVHCYGKLTPISTVIYAMSNGCEGETDNYNYETGGHFLDWESFVSQSRSRGVNSSLSFISLPPIVPH